MARNRTGGIHSTNLEWGRKARKQEARDRGLDNSARREAISEMVEEMFQEEPWDFDHDDGPEALDWYAEVWADQYDDDPNPYHGTYSED